MISKAFIPLSASQIDIHNFLDHCRHLILGKRRSDDPANGRRIVGAPTKRNLVMFHTLLVHAQNTDIGGMMMPAGIDAARNVQSQLSDFGPPVRIGKALKNLLGKRQ